MADLAAELGEAMPTYVYSCTSCGERIEAVQRITDDPLTTCQVCSGALRKVFQPVGVVFKGSGFYKTDSRSSGSGGSAAKSSEGSSGSSSSTEGAGSSSSGSGSDSGSAASSTSSAPGSSGSSSGGSSSGGPAPKASGSSKVA